MPEAQLEKLRKNFYSFMQCAYTPKNALCHVRNVYTVQIFLP